MSKLDKHEYAIVKSKYFDLSENWGDPKKVSIPLIKQVDKYREALGHRLHISPIEGAVYAEDKGHTEDSWHYIIPGRNNLAMALDAFPEGDLFRAWILALKFPFSGVGVYPYWKWPAKGLIGGIHIDVRPVGQFEPEHCWWRDKTGAYRSITKLNDINALMAVFVNHRIRKRSV